MWLATTSECVCGPRVAQLSSTLSDAQQQVKQYVNANDSQHNVSKALARMAGASSALIDALGECGHPGEAKTVFEDSLSSYSHARLVDGAVVSLETIADSGEGGAWRAFSALIRCYVRNGLVQRAFDLLAQVKVRDEKMLDPSIGVLGFSATVVSAERQVVLQRVYATFSAGNLGLALGSRDAVADSGCVVISTGNQVDSSHYLPFDQRTSAGRCPSSVVEPNDVVETVNGEMVLHYPFPTIVARLKRAYRPMTVTLLRGMAKATSLHAWCQELSGDRASVVDPSAAVLPSAAIDSQTLEAGTRSALCDRFGLLPMNGIRITAVADCAACSSRTSLADIQAGWSMTDENDYTTRCARCERRFVPRLSVELDHCDTGAGAKPLDVHVEYLSTLVVRKELANLARKLPLSSLTMAQLRVCNPRIYWNVVVKLLALACPLDFMDLPGAAETDGEGEVTSEGENDERASESASSEVSASCGTEPRPLTDDENRSMDSEVGSDDDFGDTHATEHGEIEDSDGADNNNDDGDSEDTAAQSSEADWCHDSDDIANLERVFLAAVEDHKRVGESLDDVASRVLEMLRRRVVSDVKRASVGANGKLDIGKRVGSRTPAAVHPQL